MMQFCWCYICQLTQFDVRGNGRIAMHYSAPNTFITEVPPPSHLPVSSFSLSSPYMFDVDVFVLCTFILMSFIVIFC